MSNPIAMYFAGIWFNLTLQRYRYCRSLFLQMRKLLAIFFLAVVSIGAHAQQQFWGTASQGGLNGDGFIFKTDSIGDNLEIVHHFKKEIDGNNISALLLASNNKLYGFASSGGQGGGTSVFAGGTFFEYDLATNQFRVIEHFGPLSTNLPNLYTPRAEGQPALTEVSPGLIYGLMTQGSNVFSYNFNTGVFSRPFVVPNYNGGATNSSLRNRIAGAFHKAANGNLYAATITNSSCPIANPNMGSIFRVVPSTNALTIPHKASCQAVNGWAYNAHFVEISGKLYSTTNFGGATNQGVIYEFTLSTNTYVKRHDFQDATSTSSFYPTSLTVARTGKLYGTAHGGGVSEQNLPSGGGILYEYDLQTNTFTKKYDFLQGVGWLGDVGAFASSLITSTNGKLYGSTEFGIFEYNTTTSELRMAGRFWTRGFAPSIVQVCRKPSYEFQSVTTREVCPGQAFTLDLESPNATTVTWTHNTITDPSRTTSALSFESFTAADEGTWICTMTNECGTTTAQAITLVLNDPDQPTITAQGPLSICDGETVTLTAPDEFDAYTWSTGETSREIVVNENGEYSVSVNNGCESPASESVTVTVHELPPSPTSIESPSYNKLKAIGTSTSYEWTLDGTVLSEQSAEITVAESGVYKVWGVNASGCRSADFASLSFVVTALESDPEKQIAVYPNPASTVVYVDVTDKLRGPVAIQLFNSAGQLIIKRSANFNWKENEIAVGDLPAGMYHLLVRKGSHVVSAAIVIR
jgi:uncharacterized repeat protein (TIGR03803 family)